MNLYWVCIVPATARLFLCFYKLTHNPNNNDRIRLARRDQRHVCVGILPSTYGNSRSEYFFIDSTFIPSSEAWLGADEAHYPLQPKLSEAESRHATRINLLCQQYGFSKAVPYFLAQ